MTLETLGIEARHELARLRPTWKCSVRVHQGMTYTLGRANEDDPRFDPLQVSIGATGPITEETVASVRAQVAREVTAREQLEKKLLRR